MPTIQKQKPKPKPRDYQKSDKKKAQPAKPKSSPPKKTKSKLTALLKFDAAIRQTRPEGCYLIGLDEVGRGSLIGPVVAGAVCLPCDLTPKQKKLLAWLDDSKKLNANLRAELSEAIHEICMVGIGSASKEEVDALNIHYASLLAVFRAFEQLCAKHGLCFHEPPYQEGAYLLLDGRAVMGDYPAAYQQAIVKGDGKSAAIAAASIVAKHDRDSAIIELAKDFPGYDWENNMGYATPLHLQGIQNHGVTLHHRKNFKRVHEQLLLPLGAAD